VMIGRLGRENIESIPARLINDPILVYPEHLRAGVCRRVRSVFCGAGCARGLSMRSSQTDSPALDSRDSVAASVGLLPDVNKTSSAIWSCAGGRSRRVDQLGDGMAHPRLQDVHSLFCLASTASAESRGQNG